MRKFLLKALFGISVIASFNLIVFKFAEIHYYSEYRVFPSKKFHSFLLCDSHGLPLENFLEHHGIYNFSAGSDSYFDMNRKLNFLIRNQYQIDTIYITVDNHTLSTYREGNNNSDRSNVYTSNEDYKTLYQYCIEKYILDWAPIFKSRVRDIFWEYITTKATNENKKEKTNWMNLSEQKKKALVESRFRTQFGSSRESKMLSSILNDLINICKTNNIELIGVKFPVVHEYYEKTKNHNFKADSIFVVNNLKVIDYSNKTRFEDGDFANQDHLNKSGGKKLASIWMNE